jgi:hypothetical protein
MVKKMETVDIGAGVLYPKKFSAIVDKFSPEFPDYLKDIILKNNAEIIARGHPPEHLVLEYSETIDGFAVFKNEYGYEKRIKAYKTENGKNEVVSSFYVDGKESFGFAFIPKKIKNANLQQ